MSGYDPARYEAWYQTPRGRWIAERESRLLRDAIRCAPGDTLLDAGCGTGHFSRRLAADGLEVSGVDLDGEALAYADRLGGGVRYLRADLRRLPFSDARFDHVVAITSLGFVADPRRAVEELWRVTHHSLSLGLLNRDSLLHRRETGRGGYGGARWDRLADARGWLSGLRPAPLRQFHRSALLLPEGRRWQRLIERLLPATLPWGGFVLLHLRKG